MHPDQWPGQRASTAAFRLVVTAGVLAVVRLLIGLIEVDDGQVSIWFGRIFWFLFWPMNDWSGIPLGLAVAFAFGMRAGRTGARGGVLICSVITAALLALGLVGMLAYQLGASSWQFAAWMWIIGGQLLLLTVAAVLLVRTPV